MIVIGHAYTILDTFELIQGKNGVYDNIRKTYLVNPDSNEIKLVR